MGTTLTPVNFVDDDFTIIPHTSNCKWLIDKPTSIREFAEGTAVKVSLIEETGEYLVENTGRQLITAGMPNLFMEGPAA